MIEALLGVWAVLAALCFVAAVINIERATKWKNAYRNEYNLWLKAKEENGILLSELTEIEHKVRSFVEEHNSWHDRKITFYFDHEGWHCCYCDEKPQGDVVTAQEEINEPNENNDENNQSI